MKSTGWAAIAVCGLVATTAATSAEQTASAPRVVAFNASVQVEVDATGQSIKVAAPADLPEAIRGYIEKRVTTWQYTPGKVNGLPQPSTTYVQVNACAVPVAQGYRLGLDYAGNGLRPRDGAMLPSPDYLPSLSQAMSDATYTVILAVDADGKGRLDRVESVTGDAKRRAVMEKLIADWAKRLRFDTERVGGRGVASRVRVPLHFIGSAGSTRKQLDAVAQAKAVASPECAAAAGSSSRPVAMDPAVGVNPVPRG